MAETVMQTGGVGGGHLVCDGKDHFWVVPEHEAFKCAHRTHVGACPGADLCKPQTPIPAIPATKVFGKAE